MSQTVTNIECLTVAARNHRVKEKVYSLAVTWSDGATTRKEVVHSALIEFRNRLRHECYRNKSDVIIPEVPALNRLELAAVGRRDEKRKKLMQEFCQQILKLPYAVDKARLISEFLSTNSVAKSEPGSSTFYTDINSAPRDLAPANGNHDNVHYADWADNEIASADQCCSGSGGGGSHAPAVYAEVVKVRSSPSFERDYEVVEYAQVKVLKGAPSATVGSNKEGPVGATSVVSSTSTQQEPLYAVVGPQRSLVARLLADCQRQHQHRREDDEGDDDDDDAGVESSADVVDGCLVTTGGGPKYVNVVQSQASYMNISGQTQLTKLNINTTSSNNSNNNINSNSNVNVDDIDLLSESSMLTSHDNGCSMTSCNTVPSVTSPTLHVTEVKSSLSPLKPPLTKMNLCGAATAATKPVNSKSNYIRVVAIADFEPPQPQPPARQHHQHQHQQPQQQTASGDENEAAAAAAAASSVMISFSQSDVGELIYSSESRWLYVRIGARRGWVPADYWRISTEDGRMESFQSAPWMVGPLGRKDCEQLLLRHGEQQDFVVRQSKNLGDQLALSVKYNDRLHHFPIVPTSEGKFYIGKHHFSTIDNIVIYYKKNQLFVDEFARPVTLGNPLKKINL